MPAIKFTPYFPAVLSWASYGITLILILNYGSCEANFTAEHCENIWSFWNGNYMTDSAPLLDIRPAQSICSINPLMATCCNPQRENQMFTQSSRQVDNFYRQWLQRAQEPMLRDALVLQSLYRSSVETTKQNLNTMFTKTYGYQYISNKEFFFNLFRDLQSYLDGQRSGGISLIMEAFFNELRERMARLTLNTGLTEPQIQCVVAKLRDMNSFGQVPQTIQNQMMRTYPVSRMFVNALNLGAEVVQNMVSQAPAFRQCAVYHMRTVHCSTCAGIGPTTPCAGLCNAMFTKCLAPYADLAAVWSYFISTMKRAAEKMEQPVNLPSVNNPLQVQISEAIMDLHTILQKKKDELVEQCRRAPPPGGGGGSPGRPFNFSPESGNPRLRSRRAAASSELVQWQERQLPASSSGGRLHLQRTFPQSNNLFGQSGTAGEDMGSAPLASQTRTPDDTLTRLVQKMKTELSAFDKLFSGSMGICDDAAFGVATVSSGSCWNGTAIDQFSESASSLNSLLSVSTMPQTAVLNQDHVSNTVKRESERLQDMTAKLTLAIMDQDPDYMQLSGHNPTETWVPPQPQGPQYPPVNPDTDGGGPWRGFNVDQEGGGGSIVTDRPQRTKKPKKRKTTLAPTLPPQRPLPDESVEGSGELPQPVTPPRGRPAPVWPPMQPQTPPPQRPHLITPPSPLDLDPIHRPQSPQQPKNPDDAEGSGMSPDVVTTLSPIRPWTRPPNPDEENDNGRQPPIVFTLTSTTTTTRPTPPSTPSPTPERSSTASSSSSSQSSSAGRPEEGPPTTPLPPLWQEDEHIHIDQHNANKMVHLKNVELPPDLWLPPEAEVDEW